NPVAVVAEVGSSFLAAYSAVNGELPPTWGHYDFLAAYSAVNGELPPTWGHYDFLAAYTAVNRNRPRGNT
ncbi:hypothetical protein, partial [Pseudomonas aeruginosa]|uniref:hypothetical protein n=1 Tax=Pseudomonas aeruginosa TaxID=287 RepID=UPI001CC16762